MCFSANGGPTVGSNPTPNTRPVWVIIPHQLATTKENSGFKPGWDSRRVWCVKQVFAGSC